MNHRLVTVGTFWNSVEAELARGRLEDAGIRAFLADETMVGMAWYLGNAIGGVKLQVGDGDAEAAREVLSESDAPAADAAGGPAEAALPIEGGPPASLPDDEAHERELSAREENAERGLSRRGDRPAAHAFATLRVLAAAEGVLLARGVTSEQTPGRTVGRRHQHPDPALHGLVLANALRSRAGTLLSNGRVVVSCGRFPGCDRITNAILYHLASGDAFFSGGVLLVVAVVAASLDRFRWRWFTGAGTLLGAVLVVFSVTPLPAWIYGVLAVATLLAIVVQGPTRVPSVWRRAAAATAVIAWTTAALWELPYHRGPTVPRIEQPIIGIIGDSLSAGDSDDGLPTWPQILAETRNIDVRNHAKAGATTASAAGQAKMLAVDESIVILEIGGNDVLGTTKARLVTQTFDPASVVVRATESLRST